MKTLFTSLLLLVFTFTTFAQENRVERIKAMKTAFITEQLDLTAAEAEKFWPVYNKFEKEIHTLKRQARNEMRTAQNEDLKTLNDAQAKEILDRMRSFNNREQELQNQKEAELLKVLSPGKVLRLKKAEHDFQMQLLKKYRGGNKK
jgi:Skp family chaperone for outer membrane proteins